MKGTSMISKKMEKALNSHVNAELYSSYLYLSMESYFNSLDLKGFASWMRCQVQEELFHAMKIFGQINERGGRATLNAIDGPPVEWKSPQDAFNAILKHEQMVTGLINSLVNLALKENDHATNIFLQWFVTEQVEEEDNVNDVVRKLKLMGDAPGGLFIVDKELSARIFTMPVSSSL